MFGPPRPRRPVAIELLEPRIALAAGDDYGNYPATAFSLRLDTAGGALVSGVIERPGDVDFFRLTANVTGRMTITQTAPAPSRLDPYLDVYNFSRTLLARNDDSQGSLNSQVAIDARAGATYFIKAAGFGGRVGAYRLTVTTARPVADDFPNTFANAKTVTTDIAGSGVQKGAIEQAGDVDMFRVVAAISGQMTVTQSAAPGSALDSYLYVYDASRSLLADNDDFEGSRNSQVTVRVTAGATYFVKAGAYGATTGAYVLRFSTVAGVLPPPQPAPGGFQITLSLNGLSASQQALANQAAGRWERVIIGDLPNVRYQGRTIDDVLVVVRAAAVDGPSGILAQAGPGTYLPYVGSVTLDTADLAQMEASGDLLDVLAHEIGHVLGFGTLWTQQRLLAGAGTSNPRFIGARATAEYNALFNAKSGGVPVEAGGGPGTALAHWRESVFRTELMTGWSDAGTSALSRVTVAAMADMGYQVNLAAAEPFTAPLTRAPSAKPGTAAASAKAALGDPGSRRYTRSAAAEAADWGWAAAFFDDYLPPARTGGLPQSSRVAAAALFSLWEGAEGARLA